MAKQLKGTLLTEREAAEQLGIRWTLLQSWRIKGLITPAKAEGRGALFYDAQDIQRIKRIAQRLSRLDIPNPVSVIVNRRIPVCWMTQLLGISRQRVYQIVPGSLSIDHALTLLKRYEKTKPEISHAYRTIRELKNAGLL